LLNDITEIVQFNVKLPALNKNEVSLWLNFGKL